MSKTSMKRLQLQIEKLETHYEPSPEEYSVSWKNIVFLPFNSLWRFAVTLSVVFNSFLIIYYVAYVSDSKLNKINYVYYSLEILYFMDTLLYIMHRNMPRYRIIKEFEPKHVLLLTIDVISLLPIFEIYVLLLHASSYKPVVIVRWARNLTKLKGILRLYSVLVYFIGLSYQAGLNHLLIVGVSHFIQFVIGTQCLAAIWYYSGCYRCGYADWTDSLQYHIFDNKDPISWFIICYSTIGNSIAHNYRCYIQPKTVNEYKLLVGVIFVGFILHFMIFFGRLTAAYVKSFKRQFLVAENLNGITCTLDDWSIETEWRKKTIEYYNVFWKKRSGIKNMPFGFNLLPLPLQKEVTSDIFWDALAHSQIFSGQEMAFKRALSLEMRSEFYLPGDYVFQVNKLKTKMIYIVSGVLQILTDEDEESPIISFSSGTILGEMAILLPCESNVHVRCATYCELQTLSIVALYRTLRDFPTIKNHCQNTLIERIEIAEELKDLVLAQSSRKTQEIPFGQEENTIRWLKLRWRQICNKQHYVGKKAIFESKKMKMDPSHTSEFLDLLVLSEDVELKTRAICLSGHCPFVLEPTSSFRAFGNYVVMFAVLLQFILLPYNIAFKRQISSSLLAACFISDFIYFIDLYLQLSTAIKMKNYTITKPSRIVLVCLKDSFFLIDIIGTIPLDYGAYLLSHSEHVVALLRLNRLLKIYKIVNFIVEKERNLWSNTLKLRIIKYITLYVLITYLFTCIGYAMACFNETCDPHSWYLYSYIARAIESHFQGKPTEIVTYFRDTLYYTISTFWGIGMSGYFEYTLDDTIYHHFVVLAGYFLFSYCFAEMCATFILRLRTKVQYHEHIRSMNQYMIDNMIVGQLKNRINNFLEFQWYYNRNINITGEDGIFNDATEEIKTQVIRRRIIKCLERVPLFLDLNNDDFLESVAAHAIFKTLPPHAIITSANNKSSWMHVILRGYCQQKSVMAGDRERNAVTILNPGDSFPVVEMLHQVLVLVDVTTLTAVEVISIRYLDLLDVLQAFPTINKHINEALEEHLVIYEAALLRRLGRLPEMIPAEKSFGQGELFTYDLLDDEDVDLEKIQYMKPYRRLGKWSFVRFFLMRKTINPSKTFFICWESFRCCCALVRLINTIFYINLRTLTSNRSVFLYMAKSFSTTCYLDMYVRMHCQYYNEMGILVTHPWSTAKYYIKTSLLVDFIATIPISLARLDAMYGRKNKFVAHSIIALMTRPLQLHRLVGALTYLQGNIRSQRSALWHLLKYVLIVLVFIFVSSALFQIVACSINENQSNVTFNCSESYWLRTSVYTDHKTAWASFLDTLYICVTLFTTATCGKFGSYYNVEKTVSMIFISISFVVRWYVFSVVTSYRIGGNVNLTIFQERVKSFLNFMDKEYVDEDLVQLTVEHNEYMWKRTLGSDTTQILRKFNPNLHEDVAYHLYAPCLRLVDLFAGADNSFFRLLGVHLREFHFKKDAEIIRVNDVQGLLFFMYRGRVDVNVAMSRICTLGLGGVFGNLQQANLIRQTILVVAKIHVDVLAVESNLFHKLVSEYPSIVRRLKQVNYTNAEFIESKKNIVTEVASHIKFSSMASSNQRAIIVKYYKKMGKTLNQESRWYKLWQYLMFVHVASLSALGFLWLIFINNDQKLDLSTTATIYLIDFIFYIKIFFGFHLRYFDPESGILITDFRSISRRYLKSPTRWWLDLMTCIPFEVFASLGTSNDSIIRFCLLNRVFRFLYLALYYKECQVKLTVTMHLRWTYLIYWLFFTLQCMTCLWWMVACRDKPCEYYDVVHNTANTAPTRIYSIVLAYTYIVNLFTATGLRAVRPRDVIQTLVSVVIAISLQFITHFLISGFATVLAIGNYTMSVYEYKIEKLRIYLQGRELSPSILKKVWTYCLQLWHRQRGEWMPALITEAPNYLKQDLMDGLYGYHLSNHILFQNTHVDFLRQLLVHLQRCVFFPGNYIAEKGDMDGSMYFIHDGEVEVYDINGNNENLKTILRKGTSFGEAQGIYQVPFDYSYKAHTVVDALILRYRNWQYLLEWFPAARQEIYNQAIWNGLTKIKVT